VLIRCHASACLQYKKMTPAEAQYWQHKSVNMDLVLFFKVRLFAKLAQLSRASTTAAPASLAHPNLLFLFCCDSCVQIGKFYEMFDSDADVGVKELSVATSGKRLRCGVLAFCCAVLI